VAAEVSRTRGIGVGPRNVSIVPGGKPIMFFTLMALLEEGDEVFHPTPGFPIYKSMIRFLGAVPVPMPQVEERGFVFDLDLLRSKLSSRTRFLILNSPENPAGGVIPPEDIRAIADLVRERDMMVLAGEIYLRIVYGVSPEWVVSAINYLMVNCNSCTASFTQHAALAALTGPQEGTEKMVAELRRRRDAFCVGVNSLPGIRCRLPEGAFHAFANITGTRMTSQDLADRLLDEAGVACLSGTAFGDYGEGYLRFSYANSYERLMEAVERIGLFLSKPV
jgi:aspartate/methionine/tyrosine aminotransferase